MTTKYFLIFCFFGFALSCVSGDIDDTIRALASRISSMQTKITTKAIPPLIWLKEKGLYESDVKMYFHGDSTMYSLRQKFGIFDNNMFATCWITIALLEAYRYGNAPKPCKDQINLSVDTITTYTDKNNNHINSLMTFWPQVYNRSTYSWQSTPQNLLDLFDLTEKKNFDAIAKILNIVGEKELAYIIKFIQASREAYKQAFMIPADFDDTFVNLGLGSMLKEMSSDYPQAYASWSEANANITSVLSALKKYAYRPMSYDKSLNTIDPRAYFHLRKFLEDASSRGEDIALTPTWVQNTDEVRTMFYRGVGMPLNINNVDCTVAANVVFGITNAVLTGVLKASVLDDPELQQIYRNTTNLIAYEIQTNFTGRKDLALTYYPSEFEFYWFVARTYTQIQRYSMKRKIHPVLQEACGILGSVLKEKVTDVLTSSYQLDGENKMYFDDFLGNGDVDRRNCTVKRAEDRIFTTAMAVNALMTIWTVNDDKNQKLVWDKDTPFKVFETVRQSINWLQCNVLSGEYKPWNAFFSGSVKGFLATSPYVYPNNVFEYLNGTNIKDFEHFPRVLNIMVGMQGVQSDYWYESQLQKPRFGVKTPTEFNGYNSDPSFFPFWSSEPYTYAVSMMAMAKYRNAVFG